MHNMGTAMDKFLGLCDSSYAVLQSLLSCLSATDASAFLSATGIRFSTPTEILDKYLDVHRDMPEYEDWMKLMILKGHTVLLAGADLDLLRYRLKYPFRYWKKGLGERKLRLWLLVAAMEAEYEMWQRRHAGAQGSTDFYINVRGDVSWDTPPGALARTQVHNTTCTGAEMGCGELWNTQAVVLPPPRRWQRCVPPSTRTRLRYEGDWVLDSTSPNRIEFVVINPYAYTTDFWNMNLGLCPYNDVGMQSLGCLQPYFSHKTVGRVDKFSMPYMNMTTGKYSQAVVLPESDKWAINRAIHNLIQVPTEYAYMIAFALQCTTECKHPPVDYDMGAIVFLGK